MFQGTEQTSINFDSDMNEFKYGTEEAFTTFCNEIYLNVFYNLQIIKPQCEKKEIEKCTLIWNSLYEFPSRTVVISNIPNEVTQEEFEMIFKDFGDIEGFEIQQQSKLLVRFFDLRDAMYIRASKIYLRGRQLIMSFTTEISDFDKKTPPNNGTIVLFHVPEKALDAELFNEFKQFGEIREIRRTPYKDTQRFIEFYDKRCATEAKNQKNKTKLRLGGIKTRINIEYSVLGNNRINYLKFYQNDVPTITRNNRKSIRKVA